MRALRLGDARGAGRQLFAAIALASCALDARGGHRAVCRADGRLLAAALGGARGERGQGRRGDPALRPGGGAASRAAHSHDFNGCAAGGADAAAAGSGVRQRQLGGQHAGHRLSGGADGRAGTRRGRRARSGRLAAGHRYASLGAQRHAGCGDRTGRARRAGAHPRRGARGAGQHACRQGAGRGDCEGLGAGRREGVALCGAHGGDGRGPPARDAVQPVACTRGARGRAV